MVDVDRRRESSVLAKTGHVTVSCFFDVKLSLAQMPKVRDAFAAQPKSDARIEIAIRRLKEIERSWLSNYSISGYGRVVVTERRLDLDLGEGRRICECQGVGGLLSLYNLGWGERLPSGQPQASRDRRMIGWDTHACD